MQSIVYDSDVLGFDARELYAVLLRLVESKRPTRIVVTAQGMQATLLYANAHKRKNAYGYRIQENPWLWNEKTMGNVMTLHAQDLEVTVLRSTTTTSVAEPKELLVDLGLHKVEDGLESRTLRAPLFPELLYSRTETIGLDIRTQPVRAPGFVWITVVNGKATVFAFPETNEIRVDRLVVVN